MEMELSLELLPFEVLVQIASYLGIQDINACCATSSLLRDAFNDNLVWKRYVKLKLAHCLKQSLAKPFFMYKEEDSTLSPICSWRKNYMMQVYLFKNWRQGIYKKEEIVFEFEDSNICCVKQVAFYESDYLFIHTQSVKIQNMLLEIWNVKDTPFHHSNLNINFSDYVQSELLDSSNMLVTVEVVGNKLVVAKNNLVLIYDISLSSISNPPLDHAFLFDASEEVSKDQIKYDKKSFPEKMYPKKNIVFGNYFVGSINKDSKLHIWNIQSGKKVKEECVPTVNSKGVWFKLLSSQSETNIIVKELLDHDLKICNYYGYDLAQLEFSSFVVEHNYYDIQTFTAVYVAGVDKQKLVLYNYKTSEEILTMKFNYLIKHDGLTFVENNLLIMTLCNTVHVLNLSTRSIINSVTLRSSYYSLHARCDKFVFTNSSHGEVWEIGETAKQLFKFPYISFVAVNESCTKLVVKRIDKVLILNFGKSPGEK